MPAYEIQAFRMRLLRRNQVISTRKMHNFSEAHTTDAVFAQAGPQAGCYLPFPRLVFLLYLWQVASCLCLLTSWAVFCKDDINGGLSLKQFIPHAVTLSSTQDPLMYNEQCMYIV